MLLIFTTGPALFLATYNRFSCGISRIWEHFAPGCGLKRINKGALVEVQVF